MERELVIGGFYRHFKNKQEIFDSLIERANDITKGEIEALIEGKTIEKPVHEDITYDDVYDNLDNLWNFMFFTGYFKKISERMDENTQENFVELAIPNLEVKYIFRTKILKWFNEHIKLCDMTKMFNQGIYDNAIASSCFYGVSGGGHDSQMLNGSEGCLYSWDIYNYIEEDASDPYSIQDITDYEYVTVTGTMPRIWEYTDGGTPFGLDSFAYHQIGISNFNDIPQDDRHMVGYSNIYEGAPDWLKAMNNEQLVRYLGRVRRMSEFSGLKEFKKEDFYEDGKHTGRTISQI